MKKFGHGSQAIGMGYDLTFITGWLENLIEWECCTIDDMSKKIPEKQFKRLEKAEEALSLLKQVNEI